MNIILNNTLKTLALGLVLAASLHSAQAGTIGHTFVSHSGNDGNPCTQLSPCLTFQGALANTSVGGMISALDSGDYSTPFGTLTINQAVTIDGTGAQASIVTGMGAIGISIAAGGQNMVVLRHITLLNLPGGGLNSGITLTTGSLIVDDCEISSYFEGLALAGSGNVVVENTSIHGCTQGVYSGATGLVSLRNVTLQENITGFVSRYGAADISHSLITQNTVGLYAYLSPLSVLNCIITGNGTAVQAESGSTIRLTGNDIFDNTTGITLGNGAGTTFGIVSTAGNNHKAGNPTPGAPTPGKIIVTQ